MLSGLAPQKAALPPPKTVNPLVARNETTLRQAVKAVRVHTGEKVL